MHKGRRGVKCSAKRRQAVLCCTWPRPKNCTGFPGFIPSMWKATAIEQWKNSATRGTAAGWLPTTIPGTGMSGEQGSTPQPLLQWRKASPRRAQHIKSVQGGLETCWAFALWHGGWGGCSLQRSLCLQFRSTSVCLWHTLLARLELAAKFWFCKLFCKLLWLQICAKFLQIIVSLTCDKFGPAFRSWKGSRWVPRSWTALVFHRVWGQCC